MTRLPKLSPPQTAHTVVRSRLLRRLQELTRRPAAWVWAPAGSGKTTLAAHLAAADGRRVLWYGLDDADGDVGTFVHYLLTALTAQGLGPTPPHPAGYNLRDPSGARLFFRDLFQSLRDPFLLVFDDYHELPAASPIHALLGTAAEELPLGAGVLFLSREAPSGPWAAWQGRRHLALLDGDALRFDAGELRQLVDALGLAVPASEPLPPPLQAAEGWAAGLVLTAEAVRREGWSADGVVPRLEAVNRYLEHEVFSGLGARAQGLLVRLPFSSTVTAAAAVELTGEPEAARLLEDLVRRHLFVERLETPGPTYRLHPLLREFLRARATGELAPAEREELLRRAGRIAAREGAVEEGFRLLAEAADWEHLAGLAEAQAETLVRQGRYGLLAGWISRLPAGSLESRPWLVYWAGICRSHSDPDGGREILREAFERFEAAGHRPGRTAGATAIVET